MATGLCTCPDDVDSEGENCLLVDVPDQIRVINGGPDVGARVGTGDPVDLPTGNVYPVVDYVQDFHQVLVDVSGTGDQLVWVDLEDISEASDIEEDREV